jgi:hypothetical protein
MNAMHAAGVEKSASDDRETEALRKATQHQRKRQRKKKNHGSNKINHHTPATRTRIVDTNLYAQLPDGGGEHIGWISRQAEALLNGLAIDVVHVNTDIRLPLDRFVNLLISQRARSVWIRHSAQPLPQILGEKSNLFRSKS